MSRGRCVLSQLRAVATDEIEIDAPTICISSDSIATSLDRYFGFESGRERRDLFDLAM